MALSTVNDFQDEGTLHEVGILGKLDEWHIWEAVKGLRGGGLRGDLNIMGHAGISDFLIHRVAKCDVVSEPKRRQ